MRCDDVQQVLATMRPRAGWPEEVAAHLSTCASCDRARQLFARVDEGLREPLWQPPDGFARAVDTELQSLNTDYRTKRAGDVGMAAPRVTAVAAGSFHRWLAARDKLGDQHKVPRASNHRDLIEAVLAAAQLPEPRRETAAR